MQPNEQRSMRGHTSSPCGDFGSEREFAEPIPEYLHPGYRALMAGNAAEALEEWLAIYNRYPSAEVCSHLARVHYYQNFFCDYSTEDPRYARNIMEMRRWAERALVLNRNSSTGHAMLAAAIGKLAQLSKSQRYMIQVSWQVRQHAEQAVLIDNNWVGHMVLGIWHRELASVHPGIRAFAALFRSRIPDAQFSESIRHFEEILRLFPDNNTIYAELAYTYERIGDLKRASKMYETCLSMPLFRHPLASYLTRIAAAGYAKLAGS